MKFRTKLTALLLVIAMLAVMVIGMSSCNKTDIPDGTERGTTTAFETTTAYETTTAEQTTTVEETTASEETTTVEETTATNTESSDPTESAYLDELFANKTELRFDENGEFRILVLSDLHIISGGLFGRVIGYIRRLLEREKPDLIILNGDNVTDSSISSEKEFERSLRMLTNILEKENIYWMHVFGNHDGEMSVTLEQQQAIYESFEHCLSKDPVKELTGVGNYVIPIYGSDSDEVKFAVWGIDSNSYLSAEDRNAMFSQNATGFNGYEGTQYDYIHFDQIEWYREVSELMESELGNKIPGLMAFHIPLQESHTAWMNREGCEWTGSKREPVCASPYNSGFFEVLRQRGDIKAVCNGHDHVNDYMVNYAGIKLCYASSISTTTYSDSVGARVFVINESDPSNVETYISYLFEE